MIRLKQTTSLLIKIFLASTLFFLLFIFQSCEKEDELNSEYGVPSNVDLTVPCPGNGTWYTTNMKEPIAKFASSAPVLYVNQFDAKVVINNWTVEITPIQYKNTGVCMEFLFQTLCDYIPQLTEDVYKGYIDPVIIGIDSNGDPIYKGVLTNGWELRYWDFSFPSHLYMNFKTNPNKNEWWKKTLNQY